MSSGNPALARTYWAALESPQGLRAPSSEAWTRQSTAPTHSLAESRWHPGQAANGTLIFKIDIKATVILFCSEIQADISNHVWETWEATGIS